MHRPSIDISKAEIWVVDDDPIILEFAKLHLEAAGFSDIHLVDSGEKFLEAYSSSPSADLVILDLSMQGLSGLDVLRKVRSLETGGNVPILVATGAEDAAVRNEAINLGASNIVAKPYNETTLSRQVSHLVEVSFLSRELAAYEHRVSGELEAAKNLQKSLLPGCTELMEVRKATGLELDFRLISSSELSGDFWGILSYSDSHLTFYIADMLGHGIASAANTFRLHEILHSEPLDPFDLGGYFSRVNGRLAVRTPTDVFSALLVGTFDVKEGTFTYMSAMTPSPIEIVDKTGEVVLHDGCGVPLGVNKRTIYVRHQAPFSQGSKIFFYSDALIEAKDKGGRQFGQEGVRALVTEACNAGAGSVGDIVDWFMAKSQMPLADDLTLVSVFWPCAQAAYVPLTLLNLSGTSHGPGDFRLPTMFQWDGRSFDSCQELMQSSVGSDVVLLFDRTSGQDVAKVISEVRNGVPLLCEIGSGAASDAMGAFAMADASTRIVWRLSTDTAYGWKRLAHDYTAQVKKLIPCCRKKLEMDHVALAIQEAVANAILHGNLGVGSLSEPPYSTDIGRYIEDIDARLGQPEFAHKQITMTARATPEHLVVEIADEGTGFDFELNKANIGEASTLNQSLGRRGLFFIEQCCDLAYAQKGVPKVTLQFDL